jgi:predicted acetyltransferase
MMNYRTASARDTALLAALNHQLIQDEGHRNPMSVRELERRMEGWLGGEYEAVIFESKEDVVGYALYRRESEFVYIRQFFIVRHSRRRGLGRSAIEWLRANSWKGQRLRVEVLVGNETGISFWRSCGFRDYCLTLEAAP